MDDRLTKALEFSNYKVTVYQQKQNLKLKLDNLLTYAYNGGIFKISRELISFVDSLINFQTNEAVLLDSRDNPVLVFDLAHFKEEVLSLYFEATNEYHLEFEKLRKARSVKQATDQ